MQAERAYSAALAGDATEAVALVASLGDAGIEGAWRQALSALLWHLAPDRYAMPRPEDVAAHDGTAGARAAVALACAQGERAAFLALDARQFEAWLVVHRSLGLTDARAHASESMYALLDDRARDARAHAEAAEAAAKQAHAEVLVDAATLRALAALALGDLDDATKTARRAFRMARTEELPPQQYLAGIALARLRRHLATPHFAVRILTALARVVSPAWHPLVRFELLSAAGPDEIAIVAPGSTALDRTTASIAAAIAGAKSADRAAFERGVGDARSLAPSPFVRSEIDAMRALLDPSANDDGPWVLGVVHSTPLIGLGGSFGLEVDAPLAAVVVQPGRPGRRVLGCATALHGPLLQTSRPGRLETAISVLALAGSDGIAREAFWSAVYGFDYEPAAHSAALEALIHRLRVMLGDRAALDRRGEWFVLEVFAPFTVPDPRSQRSLDDELLRVLARSGKRSAKDAAAQLGIPLRTVQLRLKKLSDDGACAIERHGRNIEYRVEDTTFFEPTRV